MDRKRIDLHTVALVEDSISFGISLLTLCRLENKYGDLDLLSLSICERVDRYTRPVVCSLALTMLRYSDLNLHVLQSFLSGVPTYVKQNKTSSLFKIKPLAPESVAYAITIDIPARPLHASYSSVRRGINNVLGRNLRSILLNNESSTHLFRHLRASYYASIGMDYDSISSYLGHVATGTLSFYLHPALDFSNMR